MVSKDENSELKALANLFKAFRRRTSSDRPQIPELLRLKALVLRRKGLRSSKIAKSCGFSACLLSAWERKYPDDGVDPARSLSANTSNPRATNSPARILEVVRQDPEMRGLEISVNGDGIIFRFPGS